MNILMFQINKCAHLTKMSIPKTDLFVCFSGGLWYVQITALPDVLNSIEIAWALEQLVDRIDVTLLKKNDKTHLLFIRLPLGILPILVIVGYTIFKSDSPRVSDFKRSNDSSDNPPSKRVVTDLEEELPPGSSFYNRELIVTPLVSRYIATTPSSPIIPSFLHCFDNRYHLHQVLSSLAPFFCGKAGKDKLFIPFDTMHWWNTTLLKIERDANVVFSAKIPDPGTLLSYSFCMTGSRPGKLKVIIPYICTCGEKITASEPDEMMPVRTTFAVNQSISDIKTTNDFVDRICDYFKQIPSALGLIEQKRACSLTMHKKCAKELVMMHKKAHVRTCIINMICCSVLYHKKVGQAVDCTSCKHYLEILVDDDQAVTNPYMFHPLNISLETMRNWAKQYLSS